MPVALRTEPPPTSHTERGPESMNDKQRYYASLEKQRAAEISLRSPATHSHDAMEEIYIDVGLRAFAAFQNCLDWIANLGRTSPAPTAENIQERHSLSMSKLPEMMDMLIVIREQLDRLETSIGNLEAGLRRIDKYTLDAFRQLAELDQVTAERSAADHMHTRRLAKEDAIRLATEAAQRMTEEGYPLSLAAVAREAGLKYGQIVYAFGNKENFLSHLESVKSSSKKEADTEVAAADDKEAAPA